MRTLWLVALVGCGGQAPDGDGAFAVTTTAVTTTDDARDRVVPMRLYAPTREEPTDVALAALELDVADAGRRDQLADLVATAPVGCPTTALSLAPDAPVRGRDLPLVVYSHCHECLGLSGASVARRLASHGFAVVTVDHVDNTLWNKLADDGAALGAAFLDTREADLRFAIDVALDGGLGVAVDPGRIAVVGHSFGGATVGRMLQNDDRVVAGMAMAAPFANPLMAGVDAENIATPAALLVAVEDNSITELGNGLMRDDFEAVAGPAYKLEVDDAGHWSFSDILGIDADFMPGCGDDDRQTNGQPFTYLDPDVGRGVAMDFATAFLRAEVLGDRVAATWLEERVERR